MKPTVVHALAVDASLTLEELCRACAVSPDWVEARLRDELLWRDASAPRDGRFSVRTVHRVRRMRRIETDFDAAPELAALVADLVDELDTLRAQLRRLNAPPAR